MFTEDVVTMGEGAHLLGILTMPAARQAAMAALVLNAGVLHRVGPHRLHVRLARELARLGVPVLRLDLGGIGDSASVGGAASFRESAVADARAAMDYLSERLGLSRFLVMGLCAGADNSLATALADARVAGIALVDPHSYATTASRFRHGRSRASEAGWSGAARLLAGMVTRRVRRPLADAEVEQGRQAPPLAEHRRQLRQVLDGGARVLAVFSGSLADRYNHPDQLFEYAPELRGRVAVRYFPDANHTFTERAAQARLIEAIGAWTSEALPPGQ